MGVFLLSFLFKAIILWLPCQGSLLLGSQPQVWGLPDMCTDGSPPNLCLSFCPWRPCLFFLSTGKGWRGVKRLQARYCFVSDFIFSNFPKWTYMLMADLTLSCLLHWQSLQGLRFYWEMEEGSRWPLLLLSVRSQPSIVHPVFKPLLYHFLAEWLWQNYLTFLNFHILQCRWHNSSYLTKPQYILNKVMCVRGSIVYWPGLAFSVYKTLL